MLLLRLVAFIALIEYSKATSNHWPKLLRSISVCPVSEFLNASLNGIYSYPSFKLKDPSLINCTSLSDYGSEELQCFSTGGAGIELRKIHYYAFF